MFKYKTAYFCANAKLSTQVATPVVNGCLTLGLLIDLASERIEDVSISLNSDLARCIVKEYFVGKRVVKDSAQIIEEINIGASVFTRDQLTSWCPYDKSMMPLQMVLLSPSNTRTPSRVSSAVSPSSRKITRPVAWRIADTSQPMKFSPSPRPTSNGQPLRAQIGHTEGGRGQFALRQHLGLPVERAGRGTRIDQQVAQRRQAVAEYGIGIQFQFGEELAVALFQFRHALGAVGRTVGDGGQLVGGAGQRRHHDQHARALFVRPLFRQFADRVPAMAARHRGAAELEDDPTIRRGSGRRHGVCGEDARTLRA